MTGGMREKWEIIEPLGEGGQSKVSLARSPRRVADRTRLIDKIHSYSPWAASIADVRAQRTGEFAEAVAQFARPDDVAELGALKEFKFGMMSNSRRNDSRRKW